LDSREKALADAWLQRELAPNESIVDCADEAYFTRHYDLHTGDDCGGGDVLEYTVLEA
jgi:hypothetical protein